jgi:lysophospholipase L1-like esterase
MPSSNLLNDNDRIAICGDSITEQKDYSVTMENYLRACTGKIGIEPMQFGWSGERAPAFANRMANDVLSFRPTVATTFYGMNDGEYGPLTPIVAQTYRDATLKVVQTFKQAGLREIVVGTPGCVDPSRFIKFNRDANVYNQTLRAMADIAREIAAAEKTHFADVYAVMLDTMHKAQLKWGADYEFAGLDGIHPGRNGHFVIAYAFLKALANDGQIGTINIDLSKRNASASEGHRVIEFDGEQLQLLSTRWPFCFVTEADRANHPVSAKTITQVLPFNEDLNRFTLAISGAQAGKIRITWGDQSKQFSSAALAKGINLAAEFMDGNPFSDAFTKLDAAARTKQEFETPMIKELLTRLPVLSRMLPDRTDALDGFHRNVLARYESLRQAAAAAVVPVKHSIKLEMVS